MYPRRPNTTSSAAPSAASTSAHREEARRQALLPPARLPPLPPLQPPSPTGDQLRKALSRYRKPLGPAYTTNIFWSEWIILALSEGGTGTGTGELRGSGPLIHAKRTCHYRGALPLVFEGLRYELGPLVEEDEVKFFISTWQWQWRYVEVEVESVDGSMERKRVMVKVKVSGERVELTRENFRGFRGELEPVVDPAAKDVEDGKGWVEVDVEWRPSRETVGWLLMLEDDDDGSGWGSEEDEEEEVGKKGKEGGK